MTADILPFVPLQKRPTPLHDAMRNLAMQFELQYGQPATHILLPLKAKKTQIKPWIEALVREEPEISDAPADKKAAHVFDLIVNEQAACEFAGLTVGTYDGHEVMVGRADDVAL